MIHANLMNKEALVAAEKEAKQRAKDLDTKYNELMKARDRVISAMTNKYKLHDYNIDGEDKYVYVRSGSYILYNYPNCPFSVMGENSSEEEANKVFGIMSEEDASKTKELLEEITPKALRAYYASAAAEKYISAIRSLRLSIGYLEDAASYYRVSQGDTEESLDYYPNDYVNLLKTDTSILK